MLEARWLPTSLVTLSLACGSGPVTNESASTTDDGETVGDGDGDGEPGDGDGEPGDGDGEPLECPAPELVTARFTVTPPVARAGTCTVEGESFDGVDAYEMTLDCAGQSVVVSLDSTILRMPNPGAAVELDYRTEARGQTEDRWLAIHQLVDQEALVLGAVAASRLDPPGTTLAEFFRDPALTLAAEQPCEVMTDSCGELQRLGLGVSTELFGPLEPVFDRGSWFASFLAFGYVIEVEEAIRRIPPVGCDDLSDESFALLVVWFPSD
ncbi:MAG: hypothetical protein R6X02_16370 [Enhygromyxa sp.]